MLLLCDANDRIVPKFIITGDETVVPYHDHLLKGKSMRKEIHYKKVQFSVAKSTNFTTVKGSS